MTIERWTVTGPQTIELDGVTAISAQVIDGRIDVVAHDDPLTRVEVHSTDGRPVEIALSGGKLKVGHEALSGWRSFLGRFGDFTGRARAEVYLAVPRDAEVRAGSVRGEVLVAGVQARVRTYNVDGTTLASDTVGRLEVNTVSGEVTVMNHRGDLSSDTVSGDVTATGEITRVDSNTVNGTVTLDLSVQPQTIRSNSVAASALIRLPDVSVVDARLTSVGGRLSVGGVEASGVGTKTLRPTSVGTEPATILTTIEANSVSGDLTVLGRQP